MAYSLLRPRPAPPPEPPANATEQRLLAARDALVKRDGITRAAAWARVLLMGETELSSLAPDPKKPEPCKADVPKQEQKLQPKKAGPEKTEK